MTFVHAAYFDDSGTHSQSDIAVAGAYIATAAQWQEFARNWQEVNDKEQFGIFHMTDFVARKKQFAGWGDEKRQRVISKLINIINTRTMHGFFAAVSKSDYDNIMLSDMRKKYADNHYTFAVRLCTARIKQWREKHKIVVPMEYIFEKGNKGQSEIMAILAKAAKEPKTYRAFGLIPDGFSFQSKEQVIQLQSADILAYEAYRFVKEFSQSGKAGQFRSYLKGLLHNKRITSAWHTPDGLTTLVKRLRELHALD